MAKHFLFLVLALLTPATALQAAPAAPAIAATEEKPNEPDHVASIRETLALDEKKLATIPASQLASDIVPLTQEELAGLADEALQLAQQRTADHVNARKEDPRRLKEKGTPEEQNARIEAYDAKMSVLFKRRGEAFERLSLILDEWEEKGGDEKKIAEYRKYRRAVQADTIEKATLAGIWATAKKWLFSKGGGLRVLKWFAIFVGSVIVVLFVAALVRSSALKMLSHSHTGSTLLQKFISLIVYWLVLLIGLGLIAGFLGFSIAPLFAVLGGASFILAFALQETLGNFAAGLMILLYRPFDAGERVLAAGVDGHVERLSLTSTIVRTPDNQLVTIPNSKVWNDVIYNADDLGTRRIDLEYRVRSADKAVEAATAIRSMFSEYPEILDDPAPDVYIGGLDGRGGVLQVRPWVKSKDYWPVLRKLSEAIMLLFAQKEVELWHPSANDEV